MGNRSMNLGTGVNDYAAIVWDFLKGIGYSDRCVAGIYGNMDTGGEVNTDE